MMKGLTLKQLTERVFGDRELKRDYITDTRMAHMLVQGDGKLALRIKDEGEFPMRPLAHDQLGARLKIPAAYYDRMLRDDPELLATNVNSWMTRNPETRMVRTFAGDARAILSDRYQRIDHHEIAEVALPILAKIPDAQFVSSEITEQRMYIQVVSPRVKGEVAVGDAVQAGVIISNSEVGAGAVKVQRLVWRLRCKNGMVCPDGSFRAYHVGRQIEDNADLWRDDTRKAEDRAILLKVRDMVTAAVDQTKFDEQLIRMRALTSVKVTGNPVKAVEVLAQKIGMSEAEQGGILRSLIDGGDLTAWGVLNAVTAQAHTATNYDRAVDLETAGGALLAMERDAWKEVLEAA